jgi:hypothetical protein
MIGPDIKFPEPFKLVFSAQQFSGSEGGGIQDDGVKILLWYCCYPCLCGQVRLHGLYRLSKLFPQLSQCGSGTRYPNHAPT